LLRKKKVSQSQKQDTSPLLIKSCRYKYLFSAQPAGFLSVEATRHKAHDMGSISFALFHFPSRSTFESDESHTTMIQPGRNQPPSALSVFMRELKASNSVNLVNDNPRTNCYLQLKKKKAKDATEKATQRWEPIDGQRTVPVGARIAIYSNNGVNGAVVSNGQGQLSSPIRRNDFIESVDAPYKPERRKSPRRLSFPNIDAERIACDAPFKPQRRESKDFEEVTSGSSHSSATIESDRRPLPIPEYSDALRMVQAKYAAPLEGHAQRGESRGLTKNNSWPLLPSCRDSATAPSFPRRKPSMDLSVDK
jgi:hypothetical protein